MIPDDVSMTMDKDKRFQIYVSFTNCQGYLIQVKTFWYLCLPLQDNLRLVLDTNHFCQCVQFAAQKTVNKHVMDKPLIMDSEGYLYYHEELVTENQHYVVKSMDQFFLEQKGAKLTLLQSEDID